MKNTLTLRTLRAALVLSALAAGAALPASAQGTPADVRQLAPLPDAARATLRDEMLGNLRAVHGIIELLAKGSVREAGTLAEQELGVTAMGRNRQLPLDARPGAHMPTAMHQLGVQGHQAATQFAREAASGDTARALAALPGITTSCIACHHAYRVR